jgi:hypothetical protein
MVRLLYVSVRGHRTLVGGPTLDADALVPHRVGASFPTPGDAERHAQAELRGLSAYWQVQVVDEAGTVIRRGFRAGCNGTGERWTWRVER